MFTLVLRTLIQVVHSCSQNINSLCQRTLHVIFITSFLFIPKPRLLQGFNAHMYIHNCLIWMRMAPIFLMELIHWNACSAVDETVCKDVARVTKMEDYYWGWILRFTKPMLLLVSLCLSDPGSCVNMQTLSYCSSPRPTCLLWCSPLWCSGVQELNLWILSKLWNNLLILLIAFLMVYILQ